MDGTVVIYTTYAATTYIGRKYFKMRSEYVKEDKFLINKFERVQLRGRIQKNDSNCEIYLLA